MSARLIRQLQEIHDLFDDKRHWCRGELAVNDKGNPVCPTNQNAIRWCTTGAVVKVVGDNGPGTHPLRHALELSARAIYGDPVLTVNDGEDGWKRIRAVIRRAIRRVKTLDSVSVNS